jgi:hypothetical protein
MNNSPINLPSDLVIDTMDVIRPMIDIVRRLVSEGVISKQVLIERIEANQIDPEKLTAENAATELDRVIVENVIGSKRYGLWNLDDITIFLYMAGINATTLRSLEGSSERVREVTNLIESLKRHTAIDSKDCHPGIHALHTAVCDIYGIYGLGFFVTRGRSWLASGDRAATRAS